MCKEDNPYHLNPTINLVIIGFKDKTNLLVITGIIKFHLKLGIL